jgi:sortase (surface protein transpeptidase)
VTLVAERPITLDDPFESPAPPPARPGPAPAGPAGGGVWRAPSPRPELPPRIRIFQGILIAVAAIFFGLVINVVLVSPLSHVAHQDAAFNAFRQQLAEGTAPVSELDGEGKVLAPGSPVALLDIPSIGVREVVGEGATAGDLMAGPGHRRDTVLPGQEGVSVLLGRAGAYGGPFGRIQELAPGQTFSVLTGQGKHTFRVIGVRYAKDLAPPPLAAGASRLVLTTARGPAFMPTGVARVDAELISKVAPAGVRVTNAAMRGAANDPLASDSSTVWALVMWLQAMVVVALGAVWSFYRWGRRQAWIVFAPTMAAVAFQVADQVTLLLPNLL